MFEYLDGVLAFALIALMCFLLFKVYRFDKKMDDSRENGIFAPVIYHNEPSWSEYRRERRAMKKYGIFGGIIFALVVYSVLRMNGTIGSIL